MNRWNNTPGINTDDPAPRPWEPLRRTDQGKSNRFKNGWCIRYENKHYSVTVHHVGSCSACSVMIVNADQSARRDWREFQQIKNEVAGEAWYGYEIFPPDSDVVDPSNAFFLWCFKHNQMPGFVGMNGPRYLSPDESIAPQRGTA